MNLTLKDVDELRELVGMDHEPHVVRRKVKAWHSAISLRESPKQHVMIISEGRCIKGHIFRNQFYIAKSEGTRTYLYSLFHIKTGVRIAAFAHSFFEVTECVKELAKLGSWNFSDPDKCKNLLATAGEILSNYKIRTKYDK